MESNILLFVQLPQPGLKPLSNEDMHNVSQSDSGAISTTSSKYKLSAQSQEKIKEEGTGSRKISRSSEAFCLDTYKNSVVPKSSEPKVDLFSGLNQTSVKVSITFLLL